MRFAYTEDSRGTFRPIVPVEFLHGSFPLPLRFMSLVDTGATRTILHVDVLDEAGWARTDAEGYDHIELCGATRAGFLFPMDLQVIDAETDVAYPLPNVPVWFVDGPQLPVAAIIGGEALHGLVTVFRERERLLHVRPIEDFLHEECPHFNGLHPL